MRYIRIDSPDIGDYKSCTTNGEGFRVVLWVSGCTHHCIGCHNPQTHDFLSGSEFTDDTLKILLDECDKPYINGLTLSGGDPVDSWEDVLKVVKAFRHRFGKTKDIWMWTGYTLEQISDKDLSDIDVIVDGKYESDKRNLSLAWRGSENQRIMVNDNSWKDKSKEFDNH